jgi:hypothetical protein
MTNEERDNILDQHKTIYDGYVTSYVQPEKNQPLYVQDMANDKQGLTVSNKGVVTGYKNMNINEMWADKKDTGLFSDEEPKEGYVSAGVKYAPEETFEGLHDMIGDGEDDLEHGTFGHEDEEDMVLVSPEAYDDEDYYKSPSDDELDDEGFVFDDDSVIFDDIDQDEVEGLFDNLRESLDMFKRFTKYN